MSDFPRLSYFGYDFATWERTIRDFTENARPIVQCLDEPTPLLTLRPDHGLIQLFRAHHRMPDPRAGGDVVVEHRLATHSPSGTARAITKYVWTAPLAYTMTLTIPLPDRLDWLSRVLCADGCWCSIAPRPDLGLLWLPSPDGLLEQLVMVAAMFSIPRGVR